MEIQLFLVIKIEYIYHFNLNRLNRLFHVYCIIVYNHHLRVQLNLILKVIHYKEL